MASKENIYLKKVIEVKNRWGSQNIQKPVLAEILSKVLDTDFYKHIYKTKKIIIRELLAADRKKVNQYLTNQELHYLEKKLTETEKLPVYLTRAEINKMLDFLKSQKDIKSELMLNFCYFVGCRPGECAQTKVRDINFENRTVLFRKTKTKKQRSPYIIDDEFSKELQKYIISSGKKTEDYVFSTLWKGENKAYTVRGITKKFKNIAELAGIDPEKVSGHKFRHTHAVHFIEQGGNPVSLQKQLGHSKLSTTGIYTRIVDTMGRRDYDEHPFGNKEETSLSVDELMKLKEILGKMK